MSPHSCPALPASLYQSRDLSRPPPPLMPQAWGTEGCPKMVSVTTILKLGPPGPGPQLHWQSTGRTGWRGWTHGGPGLGDTVWGVVEGVSEKSAQLEKSRWLFPWMAHFLPCSSSQVWAEDGGLPRDGPTQSTGEGGCPGGLPGLLSVPSAHQREPGALGGWGDEFVKHNRSPSGTKEGGARPPALAPQEHKQSPAATGTLDRAEEGRCSPCPCQAEHSTDQADGGCRSC